MNYELAKELKNAGFPSQCWEITECVGAKCNMMTPTLSELIEACVEILLLRNTDDIEHSFQLYYNLDTENRTQLREWGAGYEETEDGRESLIQRSNYFGKTPEEAVSRLWLALNKK